MRVLPNWLSPPATTSINTGQSHAPAPAVRVRPLFDITEPFVPDQSDTNTTVTSDLAPRSSQEYMEVCSPQRFLNEEEPDVESTSPLVRANETAHAPIQSTNDRTIVRSDETNTSNPQQSEACSSSNAVEVPRPLPIKTEIVEEPVTANNNSPSVGATSTSTAIKTEVKSEPADSSTPARQSCSFGIRCYRFE